MFSKTQLMKEVEKLYNDKIDILNEILIRKRKKEKFYIMDKFFLGKNSKLKKDILKKKI